MKLDFSMLFWVAILGAGGAICRYLVGVTFKSFTSHTFPWWTLSVNVIGCFLIGCLAGEIHSLKWLTPAQRHGISVGFLGAFTTFSAFGIESVQLWHTRGTKLALANIAANVLLGLLAALAGLRLFHDSLV